MERGEQRDDEPGSETHAPAPLLAVSDEVLCRVEFLTDEQKAALTGPPMESERIEGLGWVVALPLRAFDGTARSAPRSDRRGRGDRP